MCIVMIENTSSKTTSATEITKQPSSGEKLSEAEVTLSDQTIKYNCPIANKRPEFLKRRKTSFA